tara:strand:- start:710 stop:1972 length:1263 start_codon:yes stop_codon:yes gene_type:complete
MTLTQSEIRKLSPTSSRYKKGLGDGLFLYVERSYEGIDGDIRGGGKYFRGKFNGKEIQIGVMGTASGEYCLSSARQKWHEIKKWCITNQSDPSAYKNLLKTNTTNKKNLNDAVKGFLKDAVDIKETTHKEYKRQLENVVLSHIDGTTPLKKLEWDEGGRKIIEEVIEKIADGSKWDLSDRCRQLLCQVFDYSIDKGWMRRSQNPAKKNSKNRKRNQRNHPHISWEEVPELLKAINLNKCNSHIQSVLATKFMLMTFLRSGALARLEWSWIDEEKKLLTIPATTSGLKRRKGINDNIDHHIPITKEIENLLSRLREFNTGEKYIFLPLRQNRYEFMDPESPNNYLRNLGYKGKQRAHGWRHVARTVGVDVCKCDADVIKRQMGHLPDNKVDKAYDKSLRLDDRRNYLEKWCKLLIENGLEV